MRLRFFVVLTAVAASFAIYTPSALAHSTRYIDDSCSIPGGGYFYADGPAQYWHVQSYAPSPGGCHLWTTTVCCGPVNFASWYLPVQSSENGNYTVVAFVNCTSFANATNARYWRYKNGTGGGVTSTHSINQATACNVDPVVHQSLSYTASSGGYIKMVDVSSSTGQNISADRVGYIANH